MNRYIGIKKCVLLLVVYEENLFYSCCSTSLVMPLSYILHVVVAALC